MAEQRIWPTNPAPAATDNADANTAIALGTVFTVNVAGELLGAFIRVSDTPPGGTCRLLLRGSTSGILVNEIITIGAGGWTRFDFAAPVAVSPAQNYLIYYHQLASGGVVRYASSQNIFNADVVSGNLTGEATADAVGMLTGVTGNGAFLLDTADPTANLTGTFNASSYWVDPIFEVPIAVISNPDDVPSVTLQVDTDQGAGTLFWVITQSSTAPTSQQIQDGEDHNGNPADSSGSQTVTVSGTQIVLVDGNDLALSTTYFAHFVQLNVLDESSNIVSSDAFELGGGSGEVTIASGGMGMYWTPSGTALAVSGSVQALSTADGQIEGVALIVNSGDSVTFAAIATVSASAGELNHMPIAGGGTLYVAFGYPNFYVRCSGGTAVWAQAGYALK